MSTRRSAVVSILLGTFLLTCRPVAPREAEALLRSEVARYDSAWAAKDVATVEQLLAPAYLYFTSTGNLSDRATTLAFLRDTGYVLTRSERSEVAVTVLGSLGRVSSRWVGEGRFQGEVVRDDQTCGQAWLHEGGRWVLVTEHCVNRPAPAQTE